MVPTKTISVILSGSPDSFARFPKWAQTFENTLTFEFKTRQTNALLFYTDDGNIQGNFYCLTISDSRLQLDFRIGDDTVEESSIRNVITMRIDDFPVNDYKWHKLKLFQGWENVKLQVDDVAVFKTMNQRSFIFGNLRTNSDVFIGGIPKDINLLQTMSSPLRRHTKRFSGSIKNLIYRLYPQGISSPQLIESRGTRHTDDDHCTFHNSSVYHMTLLSKMKSPKEEFCFNKGRCYSTNDGPKCDCAFTNHEGNKCEKEKKSTQLSFFGNEWLGYDVTSNISAITNSKWENITFNFKTVHQNCIMLISGDNMNNLEISIQDGVVYVYSQFYGSDQRVIRIFNKKKSLRFDDGEWHNLNLFRDLITNSESTTTMRIRLSVDEYSDEIKQNFENKEFLRNGYVFIGGVPNNFKTKIKDSLNFFKGCMSILKFEANSQLFDMIELSDEGFSKSVIRTEGELSYSCSPNSNTPDVISFISGEGFISLPKWNSLSTGSLAFQFKTNNGDGLLLYHGMPFVENSNFDFIAFEIVDGYLWMVLDLGSGIIRLQSSPKRLDDGEMWHSVEMERLGRTGSIIVDGQKTDFSTPGVSANLIVDQPIYLGGAPFYQYSRKNNNHYYIRFSERVWNGNMGKGFIGCIKNFRLNGINVKISQSFDKDKSVTLQNNIKLGCNNKLVPSKISCQMEDCFKITKHYVLNNLSSNERDALLLIFPYQITSEAETFSALIRTEDENGILLDSSSSSLFSNNEGGVSLSLLNGELTLKYYLSNNTSRIFNWGQRPLTDNKWHLVSFQRRGAKLMLFLDNKLEKSYYIPISDVDYKIFMNKIAFGYSLNVKHKSAEITREEDFEGDVAEVYFNGYNMLENISKIMEPQLEGKHKFNNGVNRIEHKKQKSYPVTFSEVAGFIMFKKEIFLKSSEISPKLSFRFRTLQSRNLLLLVERETPIVSEKFVLFELIDGRLYIKHPLRGKYTSSIIRNISYDIILNDLKWHNILVTKDNEQNIYSLTVDNYTSILPLSDDMLFPSSGNFYFGGIPNNIQLPDSLEGIQSFRGCMSNLRVGKEYYSFLTDSHKTKNVVRGCEIPVARCEEDTCKHGGICIQSWKNVACNCKRTTFTGEKCDKLDTTYILDGKSSIIFTYPNESKPFTMHDELSIGFQTYSSTGTIFSIFSDTILNDFFIIYLSSGQINFKYNLGLKDHHISLDYKNVVNDGKYHILHYDRHYNNITFKLDEMGSLKYTMYHDNQFYTLRGIKNIVIGEIQKNVMMKNMKKFRRHLYGQTGIRGKVSGVYFNSLKLLDIFSTKHPQTFYTGTPKLVYQSPEAVATTTDIIIDGHKENSFSRHMSKTETNEMNSSSQQESDNLITGVAKDCLSLTDFKDSCFVEYFDNDDLFTPVYQHQQYNSPTPENFYLSTPSGKHLKKGKHKLKTTIVNPHLGLSAQEKANKTLNIIDSDKEVTILPTKIFVTTTPKQPIDKTSNSMIENTVSIEIDIPNDAKNDDDYSERWWSDIGAPTFHFITQTTTPSTNDGKNDIKINPFSSTIFKNKENNLKKLETTSTKKEPYREIKYSSTSTTPLSELTTTTRSSTSLTKTLATLATTVLHIQTTTLQPIINSPYIFSNTEDSSTTTIYAVRPTTPMGTTLSSGIMNGSKNSSGQQDFPRTALISIASISVIFIIAIVVFCVFRCRQAAPGSEHYSVYMNGHKPPGVPSATGYTPVPTDMSPQLMQHSHYEGTVMPNKQHTMFSSDGNTLTNCPNGYNHLNLGTGIRSNLNNIPMTNGVSSCKNSHTMGNVPCMSATLPSKSNYLQHHQYSDNGLLNNNSQLNGHLHHTLGRNGLMTSSLMKTNTTSTLETKKRAFKEWYV